MCISPNEGGRLLGMNLKIGAHTYELVVAPIEDDACGSTDFIKSKIEVDSRLSQTLKESTLIHEAMHACNTTICDDHTMHSLMDSITDQLYAFLSENGLLNKEKLKELLCGEVIASPNHVIRY